MTLIISDLSGSWAIEETPVKRSCLNTSGNPVIESEALMPAAVKRQTRRVRSCNRFWTFTL